MVNVSEDTRTAARHVLDEAIAQEHEQGLVDLRDEKPLTPEELAAARRSPPRTELILPAVVENGLVRPLDSSFALEEGEFAALVVTRAS